MNQPELFTVQVDGFWFAGAKSTPNRSESIKTVLEQHNTHPETILELQNEPNCHFQNLDFWIFVRPALRTAPGWPTPRESTLIKIKIWALWYPDRSQKIYSGRGLWHAPHPDSQTATLAFYIYMSIYPVGPTFFETEYAISFKRKAPSARKLWLGFLI